MTEIWNALSSVKLHKSQTLSKILKKKLIKKAKLVIIGSGPSGYPAAICSQSRFKPVMTRDEIGDS
jgi:fructose-1-phosphate kinase PfkB-like protein